MNVSDGLILFAACALSFTLGYIIGCVRVARFVSKQLDSIKVNVLNIEEHSRQIQAIYAKLGESNDK